MEVTVHGYVWGRTGANMTERAPDIHRSNPHRLDLFLEEVTLPYYLAHSIQTTDPEEICGGPIVILARFNQVPCTLCMM